MADIERFVIVGTDSPIWIADFELSYIYYVYAFNRDGLVTGRVPKLLVICNDIIKMCPEILLEKGRFKGYGCWYSLPSGSHKFSDIACLEVSLD